MILIGTMNVKWTHDQGVFRCPTCRQDQEYRLRGATPFLTLYFVPVVPIGARQVFVECRECRGTFDPEVLESTREPGGASDQEFRDSLLPAMILATVADGHISPREISSIEYLSRRLLGIPIDREELGQMCSDLRQKDFTLKHYLAASAPQWNDEQRQVALQAMFLAASAEGDLSEPQMAALREAAAALHLSDDEFRAAIADAIQWWEEGT